MTRRKQAGNNTRKKASGTLQRSDWLGAALDALNAGGLESVRVLSIARTLGVSRGSFYWHFEDLDDLISSVLDHWEAEITDAVLARAAAAPGSASARLAGLLEEVLERRAGRYELSIRALAIRDDRAAKVVRRVDGKRLRHITGLFREMGFDTAEADARARLTLSYLVGDHLLVSKERPAQRRRFHRLRHRLLTRR